MHKLNILATGLTTGTIATIYVVTVGLTVIMNKSALGIVDFIKTFNWAFDPNPRGILLGALWAFTDGFFTGIVVSFFYNFYSDKVGKQK